MATSNTNVQREILAQAAHDLRNPLNTIVFAAEALADFARDSPKAHLAVERIQRAVEYMTGIIQDVLVEGTSASSAIHCERFEPEEAIDEVLELNQSLAAAKGIELERAVAAPLPSISADKAGIERVLDNLVTNAVKFTQRGGRVAVGAVAKGDALVFSVADTGNGIAPDDVAKLFDTGWQRQRGHGGYGLGLAVAKRLVSAHGGRVWVDSNAGRGSTFYAALPRTRTSPTNQRGAA